MCRMKAGWLTLIRFVIRCVILVRRLRWIVGAFRVGLFWTSGRVQLGEIVRYLGLTGVVLSSERFLTRLLIWRLVLLCRADASVLVRVFRCRVLVLKWRRSGVSIVGLLLPDFRMLLGDRIRGIRLVLRMRRRCFGFKWRLIFRAWRL